MFSMSVLANIYYNKMTMYFTDASSGYESAEMSDTASVTSVECDMPSTSSKPVHTKDKAIRNHGKQEAVCFKSTHALCDNLRLILSMPELCDVMFVVGVNEVPVHGVRAILGTRSRYVPTCLFNTK